MIARTVSNPIQLYCPTTLDLPDVPSTHRGPFLYLAHRIIHGWVHDPDNTDRDSVRLKAAYLQNLLGDDYKRHVQAAVKYGLLVKVKNHSTANHTSSSYNLAEPHRSSDCTSVTLTDRGVIRRIKRWRCKQDDSRGRHAKSLRRKMIQDRLGYWIDQLEVVPFDVGDLCRQHEDDLRQRHLERSLKKRRQGKVARPFDLDRCISAIGDQVKAMRHKDWQPRFGRDTRYHSVLTNLWSKVRHMIRHRPTGDPLVGVDIKSSQPFFVAVQLIDRFSHEVSVKKKWKEGKDRTHTTEAEGETEGENTDKGKGQRTVHYYRGNGVTAVQEPRSEIKVESNLPEDVQRFIDLACTGDIYLTLGELAGYGHLSRDRRKKRVLSMIYDKDRPYNPYCQALQEHFPNVAEFMKDMKSGPSKDSYKRFARMEQRAESNFVYNHVVKRIFAEEPRVPIWTIHDSILTVPAHQDYVRDVVQQEACRLFGFTPQLERIDYGTSNEV